MTFPTPLYAARGGRLWESPEDAQHAIETDPCRFPAGWLYAVEPVCKSCDRGLTIWTLAMISVHEETADGSLRRIGYIRSDA
jgi:hypothetical protein